MRQRELFDDYEDERRIKALGGDGILTVEDVPDLTAGCRRVLDLMVDGRWHDRREIELAAGENGTPAAEGLRRMRELRRFAIIERRPKAGAKRQFEYRLVSR